MEIPLHDSSSTAKPVKITQLYTHLELFSYDEPVRHSLFVLSRDNSFSLVNPTLDGGALTDSSDESTDQLLIIDPPADAMTRFTLSGQVAALFTGVAQQIGLAAMQTQPGGEAHIRVGEHFLDIYSGMENNVAHLPALGVLCAGGFGSDARPPDIAIGSDGGNELDVLRMLARLVKQSRIQLFIPRVGSLLREEVEMMKALADDVAYLHGIRHAAADHVARGKKLADLIRAGEELLPAKVADATATEIHHRNLQILFVSAATSQAS